MENKKARHPGVGSRAWSENLWSYRARAGPMPLREGQVVVVVAAVSIGFMEGNVAASRRTGKMDPALRLRPSAIGFGIGIGYFRGVGPVPIGVDQFAGKARFREKNGSTCFSTRSSTRLMWSPGS
jgi:hypothetical protein